MVPIIRFEFWNECVWVPAAGRHNSLVTNGLEFRSIFAVGTITIVAHLQRREALAVSMRERIRYALWKGDRKKCHFPFNKSTAAFPSWSRTISGNATFCSCTRY